MEFKIKERFKVLMFLLFVITIVSCAKIYNKSDFRLIKEKFEMHPRLRIDGFYYDTIIIPENISPNYPRKVGIRPMVMYGDGTVFKMYGVFTRPWSNDENIKNLIEKLIMEVKYHIEKDKLTIKNKPNIWDWGMYRINENELLFQTYRNFQGDYFLVDYQGKILNDTTVQLKIVNNRTRNATDIGKMEEYKFVKFHLKPDSNNYIKANITQFGKF